MTVGTIYIVLYHSYSLHIVVGGGVFLIKLKHRFLVGYGLLFGSLPPVPNPFAIAFVLY